VDIINCQIVAFKIERRERGEKEDILNRPQSKALVMGGGIAGPVAALLLQRAGIEAEIYEARDTDEDYASSWLVLARNGLNVLKTLGLADPVEAEGSPIPRMILSSGKGKRFGEVPNGARSEVGVPSLVVKRGTLNRLLREEAMRQGIKVVFGKKLHDLEMTGEPGVLAIFADGTSAAGAFLIGCDGIHSRTRQLINPGAPPPQYTGMMSTGGFTRSLQLPPTPGTLHLVFGKWAFMGYHISSSDEISWFVTFPQDQTPGRSEVNAIGSDEWRQRMLAILREEQPFLPEIIGATERITGYPIDDIATQPLWHKGSVVLAGDAIHAVSPTAGQGASLAMEDAIVLAHCLPDIPQLEQAFARYESLRRERVERVVQYAHSLGSWRVMTNPIQMWFWELLMPFFLKRSANPTTFDWLYSYQVDWDAPV
jgi:2-polyprenyl-6-methoxyphenol hydroxylase-like FAD-dependent oxidoreductase